ncbi:hypothetical protein IAR55_005150 [Kwoniella newhampshirensis]|uniref:Uncharacterized protein n=1 Tax=Kwoniella newhampshirensis TaxID=1651941 RepID=A0AAW0YNX6_9TREE
MPTPPPTLRKARLPSSSPSSARLRRIAPSPVKIPLSASPGGGIRKGLVTLAHSHSDLVALSTALPVVKAISIPDRDGLSTDIEYEFVPLELQSHFTTSPEKTLFEVLECSSKSDRDGKIPLLFDRHGEFGRLAEEWRRSGGGADVPDEAISSRENDERTNVVRAEKEGWKTADGKRKRVTCSSSTQIKRRSGAELLSPRKYLARQYGIPRPILIEFRTDIFTLSGRDKIREREREEKEESTPRYSLMGVPSAHTGGQMEVRTGMGRMMREESVGTFGTGSPEAATKDLRPVRSQHDTEGSGNELYGPEGESREQDESGDAQELEDDWSMMLSAYADDDGERVKVRKDSFFASTLSSSDLKVTLDLVRLFDDQIDLPSHNRFLPPQHVREPFSISENEGSCDSPLSELIVTPHPTAMIDQAVHSNSNIWEKPSLLAPSFAIASIKRSWGTTMRMETNGTPTPAHRSGGVEHRLLSESKLNTIRVKGGGAGTGTGRSRASTLDKALPSLPPPLTKRNRTSTGLVLSRFEQGDKQVLSETQELQDQIERAVKEVDHTMTVQLWVDQEETREYRTSLKYMRYIKPSTFRQRELKSLQDATRWCESPTRPEMFQQSGCWVFGMEPKERDKWMFHHAALESLPVLRRLTTNLDEKHDYLSKGATLQIREPGVYAVYGTEDRGRAEWKFEYLVQPRISSTGHEIPNEKIVIPLGLYVSPTFFNPDRAIKTHLINVFKKTLTPNIVSEKVRPPHIGRPPTPITPTTGATPTPSDSGPGSVAKATATRDSGRTRSHTHSATATVSTTSPHSRSVSRTIGAIAKAFASSATPTQTPNTATHPVGQIVSAGSTGRATTPTSTIHNFGTKGPSFGPPGSKGRTTPTTATTSDLPAGAGQETGEEKKEKEKGKTRRRAASLFSRSRPFTPPVNIIELHPIPALGTGKTLGGLVPPVGNNGTSLSLPLPLSASTGPKPLTSIHQTQCHHNPSTAHSRQISSNVHPFLHPHPSHIISYSHSNPSPALTPLVTPALSRSASTTIRPSRPIIIASDGGGSKCWGDAAQDTTDTGAVGVPKFGLRGLMPAPRRPAMRKRPSTAEPRLGI